MHPTQFQTSHHNGPDSHMSAETTASVTICLYSTPLILNTIHSAMLAAIVILTLLPMLITSTGDGNIHLLEDEIAEALRSCSYPSDESKENNQRSRRSDEYDEQSDRTARIDDAKQNLNQYGHERRNTTGLKDQMHVLNATDFDYGGYGSGSSGEKLMKAVPRPANGGDYANMTGSGNMNRTRRSEPLFNTPDADQCLSQCVFANLQVVDTRGIPRENELWNRIQSSLKSQQSRVALRDQTRACFQELQSEAEDNGCLYSNKLERCLMLRLSDRKAGNTNKQNSGQN